MIMAQFKLQFYSWPVETPSLQVRLFPLSSFALTTKAAVSSDRILDCIVYIPDDHNLDWFSLSLLHVISSSLEMSTPYELSYSQTSPSLCIVLNLCHFPLTIFLSFKWHLSQPVVLILMFTSVIILCLKSSLCICLCHIWKCACSILFYHCN